MWRLQCWIEHALPASFEAARQYWGSIGETNIVAQGERPYLGVRRACVIRRNCFLHLLVSVRLGKAVEQHAFNLAVVDLVAERRINMVDPTVTKVLQVDERATNAWLF